MTDFETWMHDVGCYRIFRLLIKRRVGDWTPYEWDKKFSDESQYEYDRYLFVKIVETVELPDGDILVGYKEIADSADLEDEAFQNQPVEYRKFSEIELSYSPALERELYED